MLSYAFRRVPSALLVLLVASGLVFSLLRLAPGDPAVVLAGPDATQAAITHVRESLGLDQAMPAQYYTWISGLLTGDLGDSYILGAPIGSLISRSLGNTLELSMAALILALLIGGIAGTVLGLSRRRTLSGPTSAVVGLAFAVPPYVSGVLLVMIFSVTFRLLPAGGHVSLLASPGIGVQYLIMPALCLALPAAAVIARFLATSIRQVMEKEFIQTGVAKGVHPRRLLFRHILPNALPPVVTVLAIQISQMLGGAIVIEAIFAWPGIGQLLLQGVLNRDYLLVQDLLLLAVGVSVVLQTLTDLVQAILDPRIREHQ